MDKDFENRYKLLNASAVRGVVEGFCKEAGISEDAVKKLLNTIDEMPDMSVMNVGKGRLRLYALNDADEKECGIVYENANGDIADLFYVKGRTGPEDVLFKHRPDSTDMRCYVYSDPMTEDYTEAFDLGSADFEKGFGNDHIEGL